MAWSSIRGHASIRRAFTDAWRRGRLGHAYLFVGPPGVGKRLFATELAKSLLCESPAGELAACGGCQSCHLLDVGTHPDFFAVGRPAEMNELPIAAMKELAADLALKPARGGRKIAVIDDADHFNDASANCFLKTLEEPPPGSLLILVGTAAELQLPTIRSRCQVVRFRPLPGALVTDLLRQSGVTEAGLLNRLPALAEGSPGRALELADAELWQFRGRFIAALTAPAADTVAAAKMFQAFVEEAGKESAAQRKRAGLALRLLVAVLESALTGSLHGDDEERALAQAFGERLGADRMLELLERCLDAEMHLDRKVQLVLILESLADAFHA